MQFEIENKARAGESSRKVACGRENEVWASALRLARLRLLRNANILSMASLPPQPEYPPQDVPMDVVQQHQTPQPGQQEMMPPPSTPTPAPPSRKRKKNENGEPSSPAEPRRLRRSHEACARCRSKKIKVRMIYISLGGGETKGAGARPAIGPGLASPAGRHRRHFPARQQYPFDALTGLAVAVEAIALVIAQIARLWGGRPPQPSSSLPSSSTTCTR